MEFIKAFRSGVRFSGRFSKNMGTEGIKILNFIDKKTKAINMWRIKNAYHPSIEYVANFGIIFISIFILLPTQTIRAVLKSFKI